MVRVVKTLPPPAAGADFAVPPVRSVGRTASFSPSSDTRCPARPQADQAEVRYVLLEAAAGYALFERKEGDEVAVKLKDVQQSVLDFARFSRMVTLKGFSPFKTAEDALSNCTEIAEGAMSAGLRTFLEQNVPLPKQGKKSKFALGVAHHTVGGMIQDELGISCVANALTAELLRGVRAHLPSFLAALRPGDLERAQLGLAHSYSRSKVKFDVNRADKHIIQSIAILDTLDKDINTFAMRVRAARAPRVVLVAGARGGAQHMQVLTTTPPRLPTGARVVLVAFPRASEGGERQLHVRALPAAHQAAGHAL